MIVERQDGVFATETELIIYNEGERTPFTVYRVRCAEFEMDIDGNRVSPTARVSLLTANAASPDQVRRLAREYDYVADLAEKLQNEKRQAYAERHITK